MGHVIFSDGYTMNLSELFPLFIIHKTNGGWKPWKPWTEAVFNLLLMKKNVCIIIPTMYYTIIPLLYVVEIMHKFLGFF